MVARFGKSCINCKLIDQDALFDWYLCHTSSPSEPYIIAMYADYEEYSYKVGVDGFVENLNNLQNRAGDNRHDVADRKAAAISLSGIGQ